MIKRPMTVLGVAATVDALRHPYGIHMTWSTEGKLLGERQFGFPFIAATVKTHMGPARHALSQMVVAGTMTHQPPVRVVVEKE